jgi:phosphatidylglycerophosphate synthase
MFPRRLQAWARGVAESIVRPLAEHGVDPNAVTVSGFLFNCATAVVLASGHLSVGAVLLLFSGLFDMLDGALARVSKRQSDFGAFLDSVLDRYSEAAIFLALIWTFGARGDMLPVMLASAVVVGSLMISYARARAEGLGLEAKVGLAPRPERVMILGLGLLFKESTTVAALVVLAVLTHVTAIQRLYHVWRQTGGKPATEHPARAEAPARNATEST